MIKRGILSHCILAQLFCVSATVSLINECSAQRNISVVSFFGKVGTTYSQDAHGRTSSAEGQAGYGVQLLYAEPITSRSEIIGGLGYHVQNVKIDLSRGGLGYSVTDSLTIRASYYSWVLGAVWYLGPSKQFSYFFTGQLDYSIMNQATGEQRSYSYVSGGSSTAFNGKLYKYGTWNLIPSTGLNYHLKLNKTFELGIGCYVEYGLMSQYRNKFRTGEIGGRVFLKRNFLKRVQGGA